MNIYYKGKFICVKTQGYKIYKIYYFLRMYVQNYKHKLPMNINYKGKVYCVKTKGYKIYKTYYILRMYVQKLYTHSYYVMGI